MQSSDSSVKSSESKPNSLNFVRKGSLRKVIPSQHNYEHLFTKQKEELSSMYKYIHQEYAVLAEYKMIQSEKIQGVYVIPSSHSCLEWFGVIFVRSGMYKDGIFRFTISLDQSFPNSNKCPTVIFESVMFHPAIDSECNALNTEKVFSNWAEEKHRIWHVIKFIKWIFDNVEGSICYGKNIEAINLFSNKEAFEKRAHEIVAMSLEQLYDPPVCDDPHYLVFEKYDPKIHDQVKAEILQHKDDEYFSGQNSWVKPGSSVPLGRPSTPDAQTDRKSVV